MRMPASIRLIGVCLLALVGVLLVGALLPSRAHSEDPARELLVTDADQAFRDPQHQVTARIVARLRDDGRIEFCLRTANAGDVCPRARTLDPATARLDHWINSSEVSWEIPIDADLVVNPADLELSSSIPGASCIPDFERMLAATWKVATTTKLGTAFHIGGGRFLTAHHVIDGVPPFVMLTNGERGMTAAVLASDPDVDMALLQVYDRSTVDDLPVVHLRVATKSDLGRPVFLVGYPGAGPLTVSLGGIVSRVWEDEILTTSASRGGNSGGPMFDACGDVLGVLWAGNRARNFSHSGTALLRALEDLEPRWPDAPTNIPDSHRLPPGWMIWHFDRTPPDDVDCSGADGDFWVGYAGRRSSEWYVNVLLRPERLTGPQHYGDRCSGGWGNPGVVGFIAPDGADAEWVPDICFWVPRTVLGGEGLVTEVLHDSVESFGSVRVTKLGATTNCPDELTHQVEVGFNSPDQFGWEVTIIGEDGTRVRHPNNLNSFSQDSSTLTWPLEIPDGVVPGSIELRDRYRGIWHRVRIVKPTDPAPMLPVSARVSVLIESETNTARLCLMADESQHVCPDQHALALDRAVPGRWYQSSVASWTAPIGRQQLPDEIGLADNVGYSCALTEDVSDAAWQLSTVSREGTAVYIGRRQFVAPAPLFPEGLPWGIVAQKDAVFPVVQVATDDRNGLSLLEVIGNTDASLLGSAVGIDEMDELDEESTKVLVGYPWGDASRFTISLSRISQVDDRSFFFPLGGGWYRAGGPILDPCSREVLGISLASDRILRSAEVVRSIKSLRAARAMPVLNADGPPLFGSVALRQQPIYLSTTQPDFGGWICNVRASERYDVMYAIYLAGIDSPSKTSIRDGKHQALQTCGFGGRIFIVEYRSDEVPDAVCVEPQRPTSPLSTMQIEFEAPEGFELLQATEFRREPCPGLVNDGGTDYWPSDAYISLRATTDVKLRDIVLAFVDPAGNELDAILWHVSDVDPDVFSRRVNLPEGAEIAKLLVTVKDSEEAD
ncbi:MAG: trypsin-like peptidase domain-containing protein [Chloroflexi bacterium]|nr:trypsin-like peptidase domain-containing protein [Chloroflexota bacterium]MYJ91639.1 trypsin-like peptidase domain-containing protein [Chloroflexota bacterium]